MRLAPARRRSAKEAQRFCETAQANFLPQRRAWMRHTEAFSFPLRRGARVVRGSGGREGPARERPRTTPPTLGCRRSRAVLRATSSPRLPGSHDSPAWANECLWQFQFFLGVAVSGATALRVTAAVLAVVVLAVASATAVGATAVGAFPIRNVERRKLPLKQRFDHALGHWACGRVLNEPHDDAFGGQGAT